MSLLRNGFSRILKLKNNLGINNYNIPKYASYNIEIIHSNNIEIIHSNNIEIIHSNNIDAFLFPSYLPNTYKMILNKKNITNDEDIIYIKYILDKKN